MIDLKRTPYRRLTYWDSHYDKSPSDYGPPDRPQNGTLMTAEETEDFYAAHLQENIPY